MAAYFVDSNAAGAGTGADWANAYTTIANALARPILAGDTLWISDIHAETTAAAVTWAFPGTAANPNFCYCVDHTVASPGTGNLKTTGAVNTTGAASNLSIRGGIYWYGVIFTAGNLTNTASLNQLDSAGSNQRYDSCAFIMGGTGIAASMGIGTGNGAGIFWNNCTVQFGNTGHTIKNASRFIWRNTASAVVGATIPTGLFFQGNSGYAALESIDLSAITAGNTIVGPGSNAGATYILKDCKLAAGVTVAATPTTFGPAIYVTRCDSAGTNYIEQVYNYAGTQTDETTIVRTGGASDGTTGKSRKIVTTANSRWVLPFESDPIAIWNDSTNPITTLTIRGTTTGGGVPNDDDIWIDVEYLGSGTSPQGSFITTTKANNLAGSAAVNNSADAASTWGGGGAGNGFKILCPSFTPAQKGSIYVYVKVAKASSTFYIDPKIVI
jgi:hypothetical protein